MPEGRTFVAWLFEPLAHRHLQSAAGDEDRWPLKPMTMQEPSVFVLDPATDVDGTEAIAVDGRPVVAAAADAPRVVHLVHKPAGANQHCQVSRQCHHAYRWISTES